MENRTHRPGRPLPPPRLHEDTTNLKGITAPVRQIAITNIGRDEPTLLITNDTTTPAKTCLDFPPEAGHRCYAARGEPSGSGRNRCSYSAGGR
jgi:hypothetical protein